MRATSRSPAGFSPRLRRAFTHAVCEDSRGRAKRTRNGSGEFLSNAYGPGIGLQLSVELFGLVFLIGATLLM